MAKPPFSFDEKIFPVFKIAALCDVLRQEQVPIERLLTPCGLEAEALQLPSTQVSYQQLLAAYRVGAELTEVPLLALRAGHSMHVTACGIFGYALMSSASPQDAIEFATKYQAILGPGVDSSYRREGDQVIWTMEPMMTKDPSDPLYRFAVEYHLAISANLLRDAIDPACTWREVQVAYPRPAIAEQYLDFIGCPTRFDQRLDQMSMSAHWLDHRLPLSNPITNALVKDICDQELLRVFSSSGISGRIYQTLIENPRMFPDIDAVASGMGMSSRTLRRKLDAEGTSYRRILSEVRKHLALKYLRETPMTNEEIADRLGYSDAANFRKAFKQWTQQQPSGFRRGRETTVRAGHAPH